MNSNFMGICNYNCTYFIIFNNIQLPSVHCKNDYHSKQISHDKYMMWQASHYRNSFDSCILAQKHNNFTYKTIVFVVLVYSYIYAQLQILSIFLVNKLLSCACVNTNVCIHAHSYIPLFCMLLLAFACSIPSEIHTIKHTFVSITKLLHNYI